MDGNDGNIKDEMQRRLDKSFPGMEMNSPEHRESIDKFNRLLDVLKGQQRSNAEKLAVMELQKLVDSLLLYLERNEAIITEAEKKELMVITGSGFDALVKKRMAEDLIHKIKNRVDRDKKLKIEEDRRESEIQELLNNRPGLLNWIRLTRFALSFGTLTTFSHRFRHSCLSLLRNEVNSWIDAIDKALGKLLDNEYYLFSNLEYNVLQTMLGLKNAIEDLRKIPLDESYNPAELSRPMDGFANMYISVIRNADIIENAVRKMVGRHKQEHGLWGFIKNLLDEPIQNGKPVFQTQNDRMTRTIMGVLLSYYTARERVIIRSLNQIMYLTGSEGKVDSGKKYLSSHAMDMEKERRNHHDSEMEVTRERKRLLDRITDVFVPAGKNFEESMLKIEKTSQFEKCLAEHRKNSLIRMRHLVEYFIKYFIEDINQGDDFVLLYDRNSYTGYFSHHADITQVAKNYTLVSFDLVGTKLKEFTGIVNRAEILSEKPMEQIMSGDAAIDSIPGVPFVREVLHRIGERSYMLGSRFSDLLAYYNSRKEIHNENVVENYDFFINARMTRGRNCRAPMAFGRDSISLQEFIEAACSLSYFIAWELRSEGVEALLKEQKHLAGILKEKEGSAKQAVTTIDVVDNEDLAGELDHMYIDTLTGFRKSEYLNDVIIPRDYDEKGQYRVLAPRSLFMLEIFGLKEINAMYGHDVGDKVVLAVTRALTEHVNAASMSKDNIIIRMTGSEYLGFIHDVSLTGAVDAIQRIVKGIASVVIQHGDTELEDIPVMAAVYEERPTSSFAMNSDVVRRILNIVSRKGVNMVGFIKKPDYIVMPRDFDSRGNLDESLITIVE